MAVVHGPASGRAVERSCGDVAPVEISGRDQPLDRDMGVAGGRGPCGHAWAACRHGAGSGRIGRIVHRSTGRRDDGGGRGGAVPCRPRARIRRVRHAGRRPVGRDREGDGGEQVWLRRTGGDRGRPGENDRVARQDRGARLLPGRAAQPREGDPRNLPRGHAKIRRNHV